jgi:pimeloyl-ACP methyl ester carboxylesterase
MMPTRHAITRDGVELVYWSWPGDDPPVLLLHGIGNYGRYWDLFADAIAGRLRLVAPDARGHGESGRPRDGYAPEDFVADALAVLDAAGIERAVLVGHSMGGLHSIHLAARHPERVNALAIVDASPEPMPAGSERARRLLTERPARFADRADARAYLERTSAGYTDAVYRNRLEFAFRGEDGGLVWRSDPEALEAIMSGRSSHDDRWAALREIRTPTLVVRGTRSNVLADDVSRRMVRELPDARLLELDAGHNVALERPRELADAVLALAML